jgi:hypothetical protein
VLERGHKTLEEPHDSPFTDLSTRIWTAERIAAVSNSHWPKLRHCTAFRRNKIFVCLFLARQLPVGQGLFILEVYRSHTTTHHSRKDSSGRVINPSQSPLPDNKHSQQTSTFPVGFEPTISAGEQMQAYASDRAAAGTGVTWL